ncbi:uncharacterized protein EI90DRAFT_729332 [Cantharellus anzutake]|uniref:uncharacterized protein n=1 Tax=Cantharellus anzutake TaxID=1750568 RepID=UPI0019033861|nr:uncharacterized protein EI90DRAFT_729332 [Cantharellus anzutake]KAF8312177.1 hypothetical protein EI90DRAFT_729332 [Cantharellus anzutake]
MTISAFENLYGGRLAGGIVNAILGGVITVQGSLYYHRYPTDPLHVKVVVGFLWLAQMFYVVVSTCSFYHFLIKDFGVIFLGTECSAIVQFFFVFRLHLLSTSIWLPILIAGMTIVQFTFGLYVFIKATISQNVEVIPVCYFLRQNRTGIHLTDSVIRKLSIYALNTGAFTSILAIIGLLAFVFYGLHFATLLSTVPLGGAYITTLLANLHARSSLRRHLHSTGAKGISIHISHLKTEP